jgi:hypothetical protein
MLEAPTVGQKMKSTRFTSGQKLKAVGTVNMVTPGSTLKFNCAHSVLAFSPDGIFTDFRP